MPNRRNLNMAVGDVVACRVLRQRNNTQIYLPRAAVRYLAAAPGDTIYVTAGPGGVCVSRAMLTVTQATALQRVGQAAAPAAAAPAAANPAVAQIAALQAQINQIAISLGQPGAATAGAPVQAVQVDAAALQAEVRRYRRQRS